MVGQPGRSESAAEAEGAKQTQSSRFAAVFLILFVSVMMVLSIYYVTRPQPLLVQGEADTTRIDIAARVDGCVDQRPLSRGDNVHVLHDLHS